MFVNSGLGESFYIMNSDGDARSCKLQATKESMIKASSNLSRILKRDDKMLRDEINFLRQEIAEQNQATLKIS